MRTIALIVMMSALATHSRATLRDEVPADALLDRTVICFYRLLDWQSEWQPYAVRVHDEKVGKLPIGGYLHHLTRPGRHIVFVEADVNVSRSFELESGEIYYIRIEQRTDSVPSRPKLRLVAPAEGVRELGELRYAGSEFLHETRQLCLRNDG